MLIGNLIVENMALATKVEELTKKIAELEKVKERDTGWSDYCSSPRRSQHRNTFTRHKTRSSTTNSITHGPAPTAASPALPRAATSTTATRPASSAAAHPGMPYAARTMRGYASRRGCSSTNSWIRENRLTARTTPASPRRSTAMSSTALSLVRRYEHSPVLCRHHDAGAADARVLRGAGG
jgi:hypothetical protein